MEALAIIAYRQPVTRADIEAVRGVACGGVITTLMERSLIRIVGKARVLGSPFLYGTTQEFLEYLGLNSLGDLPSLEDLGALLEREAASESDETAAADAADARGGSDGAPPAPEGEHDGERSGSFEANEFSEEHDDAAGIAEENFDAAESTSAAPRETGSPLVEASDGEPGEKTDVDG
jgi:segregation and condensation protein B